LEVAGDKSFMTYYRFLIDSQALGLATAMSKIGGTAYDNRPPLSQLLETLITESKEGKLIEGFGAR
jgi:hypothetical protein